MAADPAAMLEARHVARQEPGEVDGEGVQRSLFAIDRTTPTLPPPLIAVRIA